MTSKYLPCHPVILSSVQKMGRSSVPMKRLIVLGTLLFVGVAAWRIGERLSADAIGMALGVLFGIVAGLPVALLVLASNRRREERNEYRQPDGRQHPQLPQGYHYPMPQQPPVIVLAGHPGAQMPNGYGYEQGYGRGPQQSMYPALPAPQDAPQERRFKVVGEKEEWIDEY